MVVSSSGPSIGLIIGIALGALAALAIIILVIVLCVRHRRNKTTVDSFYTPLNSVSPVAAAAAAPAASKVVRLHVIQPVSVGGWLSVMFYSFFQRPLLLAKEPFQSLSAKH